MCPIKLIFRPFCIENTRARGATYSLDGVGSENNKVSCANKKRTETLLFVIQQHTNNVILCNRDSIPSSVSIFR